jgi:hypothetical protein
MPEHVKLTICGCKTSQAENHRDFPAIRIDNIAMQKVQNKKAAPVAKSRKRRRSDAEQAKRLLKLAERHRPPQSWFDQTDCPFEPTKE